MSAPAILVMPKLGLTMEEGRIARWAVEPGARFAAGDVVAVIETDKIANEVEAPSAGEMIEWLAPEGSLLPVSAPIARWRLDDPRPPTVPPTDARSQILPRTPGEGDSRGRHAATDAGPAVARTLEFRILATPYARRLARESGVDLGAVVGSGPNGRIKAVDVERAAAALPTAVQIVPIAATQRALSAAHIEVDATGIREIERSFAGRLPPSARIGLVAMAAIRALEADDGCSVGVETTGRDQHVVATADGLRLSLSAISAWLDARAAAAPRSDASDARVLLIVAGSADAVYFAPAAPQGWAAALGLGAEREVLRRAPDGGVVTAHAMTLALSYDPASISNTAALAFLSRLKQSLEEPLAMLAGQRQDARTWTSR